MSKWKDVVKGDLVVMSGRAYRVTKIKPKGKKAAVRVEIKGKTFDSVVKLADKVKIESRKTGGKLHDAEGGQRRWATKKELGEAMAPLPKGGSTHTTSPVPAGGDPWERPVDRLERKLDEILGARLVGVQVSEGVIVPPVDVTTVASHLAIFHGGIPDACTDEAMMIRAHDAQHAEAKKGLPLAVQHWHEDTRPK